MRLDELDYALPDELIAQEPLEERAGARMLVLHRDTGEVQHRQVLELVEMLPARSLIVLNDTRVMRARLFGRKPTGGKVELLLVEALAVNDLSERWLVMGRSSKGLREGMRILFPGGQEAEVLLVRGEGFAEVGFPGGGGVQQLMRDVGVLPLPPYIRRDASTADLDRYQTVFASAEGAVAAPTAGLHLSEGLMQEIEDAGHEFERVTLHVGPGTFLPVKADTLEGHEMHEERYEVSETSAARINEARAAGRPIIAVGTTVVRTLESAAQQGRLAPGIARTRLFIRPPFEFQIVDGLLTNFHLPRSTLLALVMSFGGVESVRSAYREAVDARYRFFSYGDAMFIRGAHR